VLAVGDAVVLDGSGDETVTVGVGAGGGNATLEIYDARGERVGSTALGPIAGGRQEIELGAAAEGLAPGTYRYELIVTGPEDVPVEVQSFTRTRIEGVRYGPNGPQLVSGDLEIPLANVVEVIAE
jgi:hypothetical protein